MIYSSLEHKISSSITSTDLDITRSFLVANTIFCTEFYLIQGNKLIS